MKKIITVIFLLIVISIAGLYFVKTKCGEDFNIFVKDEAIKCLTFLKEDVLNIFKNNIKDFKTSNIGEIVSQVQKQILAPTPLKVENTASGQALTESEIILETNLQRAENNFPSLVENKKLSEAAAAKIADMFKNQYFEHISPSGINPGDLVQSFGYDYIITGENLILGNFKNEKEMVQYWMDSPGHRANILSRTVTQIGVGAAKDSNGSLYWTQLFLKPAY